MTEHMTLIEKIQARWKTVGMGQRHKIGKYLTQLASKVSIDYHRSKSNAENTILPSQTICVVGAEAPNSGVYVRGLF